MKRLFFHAILAACLVAVSGFAVAQDANTPLGDEANSGKSRRAMRVIAFGTPSGDEMDALFYEYKGKKAPLRVMISSLSSSMPMPKGESMNIYQEVQLPIEDSTETKTGYKNVGAVSLVSGAKAILIMIIPPDLSKNKIRGRAFKDSLALHPKGNARVFNMSPKVAAISAGKDALKVAVGGNGLIRWKAVAFNSVAYQIGTEGKKPGTWKVIESTECVAPAGTRTFIFIIGTEYENKRTITTVTFLDPLPDDRKDSR